VTTQVKALNERFKVELFHRKDHQIWFSDTGRALYDITQGIFAQEEEAIELLRGSFEFESGVLRLAGVGPFDLMEIVETFSKRYPRPVLSISVENIMRRSPLFAITAWMWVCSLTRLPRTTITAFIMVHMKWSSWFLETGRRYLASPCAFKN
jgi:hypothetical protein